MTESSTRGAAGFDQIDLVRDDHRLHSDAQGRSREQPVDWIVIVASLSSTD